MVATNAAVTIKTSKGASAAATVSVDVTATQPPPTTTGVALGADIGQSNIGTTKWSHAARCYTPSKAKTLQQSHKSRILCYSYPSLAKTTAATKTACAELMAQGKAAGIVNPEVHFCIQNEADRPGKYSTDNPAQFEKDSAAARAGVDQVPGASFWINLTRDNVLDGGADALKASFKHYHGAAVNMYDPNMESVATKGPKPFDQYIDQVMAWLKANGFKKVSTWEMGAKAAPTKYDRVKWTKDYVAYWVASAKRNGLTPVAICWWDPIPDYDFSNGRDSRWIQPIENNSTAVLDAWKAMAEQYE